MRAAAVRDPQRQRDVDRPAGRRDVEIPERALRQPRRRPARRWPKASRRAARPVPRRRRRARQLVTGLAGGRDAVRGTGLLLCRPDRRARHGPAPAGAARGARAGDGPVLIHICHQEGQGLRARRGPRRQVSRRAKFDLVTGAQKKSPSNAPAYTKVFGAGADRRSRGDDKIVAVTAAMPDGTGLTSWPSASPRAASTSASPSSMA
jgi:hypothetical protein